MAQLPLDGAGARLRRAREAAGQSRADIARATKISERMLVALEEGNYAALPARTYATGFARSYARAVGLDAESIVAEVRRELDGVSLRPEPTTITFEPGDPARVPSSRVAWIAFGLLVLVLGGLALWRMNQDAGGGLPSILPSETPAPIAAAPEPAPTPSAAPSGPVVLTAEAADIWLRISDGDKVLLQKTMGAGESYTIPADAADPRLRTARPDALAITIGGQPVAKLADKQTVVANVPLTAAALLARAAPDAAATAAATGAPVTGAPTRPRLRPRPRPVADASAAPAAPASAAPAEPAAANPSTTTQ